MCKLYKVTFTGELVLNGNYAEKELSVVREKDEDHNETYTFRDKQDRKVLVRQMLGDIPHDTYFVYDACDNLILFFRQLTKTSLIWIYMLININMTTGAIV